MRPIRTIATTLLIASLAVAGCGRSQPNQQSANPTSGPPAVTAAPTPKAPTPTPTARPRILSVTTTPTLRRDGGFLVLPPGAGTITFHVQADNTHKVRFYLSPTGTNGFALTEMLGQDTNGRDGWSLAWHYSDRGLLAHLTVAALGANDTSSPWTTLGLYHPEPAAAPRIVSVTTTPVLPSKDGWLQLSGAGTVTFRAQVEHALRVRFYLSPTGTNGFASAKLLGEDRDGRDGWTASWHYRDEGLLAHLVVTATGPGGTMFAPPDKYLDLYHPNPA